MSDSNALVHLTGVSLLCLFMGACGGDKPASAPAVPAPVASMHADMKTRLEELEKQGALPALDRSTDIAGPDLDANGIRDDIDAWIAALPVSEPVRKAARQVARVQQKTLLIDLANKPGLLDLADAEAASTVCMIDTAENGVTPAERYQSRRDGGAIMLKIEAITANTPERTERYLAYMGALHGTTTTLPTGQVCEEP